jgi:hypothetical protein
MILFFQTTFLWHLNSCSCSVWMVKASSNTLLFGWVFTAPINGRMDGLCVEQAWATIAVTFMMQIYSKVINTAKEWVTKILHWTKFWKLTIWGEYRQYLVISNDETLHSVLKMMIQYVLNENKMFHSIQFFNDIKLVLTIMV